MRKNLLWLLIPAMLLIILAPVMAQAQQRPLNGGFEDWTAGPGGPPDHWINILSDTIFATQEAAIVHGGSYSTNLTWISPTQANCDFLSDQIPVIAGQAYACSLWALDNDLGGRMTISLRWSTGANYYPNTYTSDNANWTRYGIAAQTAPAGATWVKIGLRCYDVSGWDGSSTIYVDDIQLYGPAPNISPSVGAPVRVPGGVIHGDTYVSIYSTITDSDGTISFDSLYVDLNGGGYTAVAHDSIVGDQYWYSIGANPAGTVVTYYVAAVDDDGARTVSTSDSYTVVADNSFPIIGALNRTPAGKLFYDHNVNIHASITDLDGTIASESLYVDDGSGYSPVGSDSTTTGNPNDYWFHIGVKAAGTVVDYYVVATDDVGGRSQSSAAHYTVHGTVPISVIQHSNGSGVLPNCYPTDSAATIEQISGIVVGRYNSSTSARKRAFIQDSQDPWSGIYVYNLPDTVQIGDSITVRDSLIEYFGETEMLPPTRLYTNHSSGHALPAYTVLNCAQFSADSCGANQEQYEGMLLQINNVTIVDTFPLFGSNRGDFWGVDDTGDSCVIANDLSTGNGADSCVFQVGHTYTWIHGIGRYTYGRYRIMPMYSWDLYTAPIPPGTLEGIVYGPDLVTPLSDVNITTYDSAENIVGTNISDINGAWTLDLAPGTYHELLTKSGYVDTTIIDIEIVSLELTSVNVSMREQVVVCTGGTIYDIENSLDPGSDSTACWPSPVEGQVTTVCGIVTARRQVTFPSVYLQDQNNTAWGGVYCYDFTLPNGDTIPAQLGDYVQMTAKVTEYYGWTELDSVTDYSLISHNHAMPPTTVTTVSVLRLKCDYQTEPLESELIRLNNVTVRSADGSSGKYWVRDASSSDSIRIDDDLWVDGSDKPNPIPSSGAIYDYIIGVVRWEGREGAGNHRGWILMPRFAADYHQTIVLPPNVTAVWSVSSTSLAATFDRKMDPVTTGNPANYSTVHGLTITAASLDVTGRIVTLTTFTQPDNLVDSLVVVGVCDSAGNNCIITPAINRFHSGITPISVVQTPNAGGDSTIWIGDIFTVKAVITSDSSTCQPSNEYMSDQSGPPYRGIHGYFGGLPGYRPFIGDTIVVTGRVAEYFQETELSDISVFGNMQFIANGPAPTPYQVATSELLAHPEFYESDLVTVCDSFVVTNIAIDPYGWVIHSLTTPADSLIVDKNGLWTRYSYVPVLGDHIDGITGNYKYDRSKFRISPRTNADFNSRTTWCQALAPAIVITPDSLHHTQEVNIDHTYPADFTISNNGGSDLDWTGSNTLAWVTLPVASGSVAPGGNQAVDIRINTAGIVAGDYADVITISSNDPVNPSATLPLTITVTQPASRQVGLAQSGDFVDIGVSNYGILGSYDDQTYTYNWHARGDYDYEGSFILGNSESTMMIEYGIGIGTHGFRPGSDLDMTDLFHPIAAFDDSNLYGGVAIGYKGFGFTGVEQQDIFIHQYIVTNNSVAPVNGLYAANYFDWDIGARDSITFDRANNVVIQGTTAGPFFGVEVVSGPVNTLMGVSNDTYVYPNTGWAGDSLYHYIGQNSNVMFHTYADMSSMASFGPFDLGVAQVETVAFAIIGGSSRANVSARAALARQIYLDMYNAHIVVTPATISDTLDQNQMMEYPNAIIIGNQGAVPLTYSANTDLAWVTLRGGDGYVGHADTDDLEVDINSNGIAPGPYTAVVTINSNDPTTPVVHAPVISILVQSTGCVYMPGDINGNGAANTIDIVYAVNFFTGRGNPPTIDCGNPVGPCPEPSPFYAEGDVNGNCAFNAIDITFFVRYLKLEVPSLLFCSDCAPTPPLPAVMPILPHNIVKPVNQQ